MRTTLSTLLLGLSVSALPSVAAEFDWQTAAPASEGLSPKQLEAARDQLAGRQTEALLAIGKVQGETNSALPPPSKLISRIEWAPTRTIVRRAKGSDNWPLTWGDDDHLYTAYGDGWGFQPRAEKKLSLGLAKIAGGPDGFTGVNIRSSFEQLGEGRNGRKASGMLMADGVLSMWVRNAENSQLVVSRDHGKTWEQREWRFDTSFGCPTFLNYGKDYEGARDEYVYIYSPDSDSAYEPADRTVLARAPKDKLCERAAYEFFVRLGEKGEPIWSRDINQRGAVFAHLGRCYRGGVTYNAALRRYVWCQVYPESTDSRGPRFQGGFGIFDAAEPWGPWTTAFSTDAWDVGPGETCSLPTKWMSADGKTMYLVFSGDDCFSVRKATVVLRP